jgi:hypothetical protein
MISYYLTSPISKIVVRCHVTGSGLHWLAVLDPGVEAGGVEPGRGGASPPPLRPL